MSGLIANCFQMTDVAPVRPADLYLPMRKAIEKGQGLALLTGLSEGDIRALEEDVWAAFPNDGVTRLAVAVRFRALLDVCTGRRLQEQFKRQGFKFIARAVHEASCQRLNTRFGFSTQKFVRVLAPRPVAKQMIEIIGVRRHAA